MAQETPLWIRPDDPGDVGKFPFFNGDTVAWTHVQALLQFAVGGVAGAVFPSSTSQRWYNRTGSAVAITEWHASLGQASTNGAVTVEVTMDGAVTAAASVTVAQGSNAQLNSSQALVVPAGSYLQVRVTAAGSGAADLVVMAKGTLA